MLECVAFVKIVTTTADIHVCAAIQLCMYSVQSFYQFSPCVWQRCLVPVSVATKRHLQKAADPSVQPIPATPTADGGYLGRWLFI